MREIKFRAFLEEEKQMKKVENIDFFEDGNLGILVKLENGVFELKTKNFKLMQYTGLKDKNGKEIYEGDILQKDNLFIKVEFKNGCFMGIKTKNYCNCEDILNKYILNKFEIVGNIFENELLADKF